MSISIYDVSVPVFVNALRNMSAWLDKAASEKPEVELFVQRLAPDMKPLPAQYQMASDSAKNAAATRRSWSMPVCLAVLADTVRMSSSRRVSSMKPSSEPVPTCTNVRTPSA